MQQLVRVFEGFASFHPELLRRWKARGAKALGTEYWLFSADEAVERDGAEAMFLRWCMTVDHAWPCVPQKIEGFLDKAVAALVKKFADAAPQQVMVTPLSVGAPHRYYKNLAAWMQQRLRQEIARVPAMAVEEQDPHEKSLFVLVGKEGVFASLATPQECRGFYAGGSKLMSHSAAHSISRAGAKVAEALHLLPLWRPVPAAGAHWIELGASPGGMTAELLERGYRVTAVDRARMDPRIVRHPLLDFHEADVREFRAAPGVRFDALLCDMNGDAEQSLSLVLDRLPELKSGALVIFTMKTPQIEGCEEILALRHRLLSMAQRAGLLAIVQRHLTYNRQEFTLMWEKV
jgi:23S rRNA (cytidine2498-2'-O)-methyltransferase